MANSATVGLLRVLLTTNTAEFHSAMKSSADSAKVLTRDLQQIGRQATAVGSALTKTLTLPLLAVGAGLAKVGADFDKARDSIRAATGATGKDLDALASSFKKVFAAVPSSMEDVATAIGDLHTRTGATGKELEGLATQVLNLARVSKSDLSGVIAATTRAFGDWSISTEKQSGALDFLWKTSQSTGIGVTRLTELVVQFGAPLRALGFDFEQAAAMMGKWEKEGVNLETVLAGLRFALGNFAKAGKEPAAALREVQEAIKGAKTESEATAIAFQAFGKRAAVDMSRAIIEGRFNIDELVASLKNSKETINSAAADTKSLGEKFSELKNRVMVAVEPLATSLVNALEKAVDMAQPLIKAMEWLSHVFAAMPGPVQGVAIAIGLTAAAAGPALFIFGQLALAAGSLTAAFTANGIATRLLAQGHLTAVGSVSRLTNAFSAAGAIIASAYAPGLRVLQSALVAVGNTTVVVTAQKGLMAVADRASALAAGIAAAAQRLLGASLLATQLSVSALMARLGLLTAAQTATAGASRVLAVSLAAVGTAASTLLAFSTIAGLLVGLGFAAREAAKGFGTLVTAWKEGHLWATLTARETDNWVRRLLGLSSGAKQAAKDFDETALHAKAATDAIQSAANRLSGDDLKNRVNEIGLAWARMLETGKATPAAAQRTAAELKGLAEQGAKIPPALNAAVTAMAALAKSSETASGGLAAASARAREYDADLKKLGSEGLAVVRREHERGVGVKKLAEEWGVAESSIERYLKSLKSAGDEYSKLVARMRGTELLETAAAWQKLLQVPGAEAKILASKTLRGELVSALDAVQAHFGSLKVAGVGSLEAIRGQAKALELALEPLETIKPDHLAGLRRELFGSEPVPLIPRSSLIAPIFDNMKSVFAGMDPTTIGAVEAIDRVKRGLQKGIENKPTFFESAFGSSAQLGQHLAQAVIGAIQGGGNAIAAAGSLVGSSLMGGLAKHLTTAKDGAKAALSGWIGGAANAVLPFVGSLMGPLVNKIVGLFGSAGRDAVKAFAEKMGGFDALSAKLATLGAEGERLWKNLTQGVGRNDPKAAQAAIAAIEKALAAAEAKAATFNTTLGRMLTEIKNLGSGLPDSLRTYLQELERGGRLTQENIDLLHELAGQGTADWKKIEEAVKRYGGDISKLGGTFQSQRLHEAWQQVIDDMELFAAGGIAAHDVLDLTQAKVIELVNESVRFGTEIPENMRPFIESLILSGELVDENGEKITDIGKLKFGETLQTSLQKLTDTIKDLIAEFNKVPAAVSRIPRNVDTTVTIRERREVETVDVGGGGLSHAAMGGIVTALGVKYLNLGGPIWKARGTDTVPAMLTPGEGVVNTLGMGVLGADGLSALNRGLQPTNIWQTLRAALSTIHTQAHGGSSVGAPPAGAAGGQNISISVDARGARIDTPQRVDQLAEQIVLKLTDNDRGLGTRLFRRGATLGII